MLRLVALNMHHMGKHRTIADGLVLALSDLHPDLIVLTEYVEARPRTQFRHALQLAGLSSVVCTTHLPGYNQVMVAAKSPVTICDPCISAPRGGDGPSVLCIQTSGLTMLAIRAPDYRGWKRKGTPVPEVERMSALECYWQWACAAFDSDIMIGDMNFCPGRNDKWDKVGLRLTRLHEWRLPPGAEHRRYTGPRKRSALDHVLTRSNWNICHSFYVEDPFLSKGWTDHPALVAEVGRNDSPPTN